MQAGSITKLLGTTTPVILTKVFIPVQKIDNPQRYFHISLLALHNRLKIGNNAHTPIKEYKNQK